MSDQDQDLAFLAHVIRKADEIREDLGSANELFDEAAHRRLVEGESAEAVQADLDRRVSAARGRAAIDADATIDTGAEGRAAGDQLQALAAEIDLDPGSLRDTLEVGHGNPRWPAAAGLLGDRAHLQGSESRRYLAGARLSTIRCGERSVGQPRPGRPNSPSVPTHFWRTIGERLVFVRGPTCC